jgi:DNA-3-methyladenine glycosylase I
VDETAGPTPDRPTSNGDLIVGADGRARCWWTAGDGLLERYHDHEWGRSPRDETGLFERLSLEAFQAGLSWRLVLQRREALRSAFFAFDPPSVAAFSEQDVDRVLALPGVIRNRAKVAAIAHNARVLVALHRAGSGLRTLTEEALAIEPVVAWPRPRGREDVPARTPTSVALARRLRAAGWRFVGPVTAYAYLQAAGWVDDHLIGCHAQHSTGRPPPLR